MTVRIRSLFAVVALAGVVALTGCGGDKTASVKEYKGVPVTGTVLQGGKPIKLKPDETINVAFTLMEGSEAERAVFAADMKPEDGTFTINGPTGQGIPAGQYKVTLSSSVYGGTGDDRFEQAFGSEGSRLMAVVGAEPGQTFVIDIGSKTLKKK